jgi:hypothetical protein
MPVEYSDSLRREKPINVRAPEVRPILAGTKTQMRLIVKPQPDHCHRDIIGKEQPWSKEDWDRLLPQIDDKEITCPYGQPGSFLWVRESFAVFDCDGTRAGIGYKADHPNGDLSKTDGGYNFRFVEPENIPAVRRMIDGERWRPSIHMPRWASRITLEVTGVRVERLQGAWAENPRVWVVSFRKVEYA